MTTIRIREEMNGIQEAPGKTWFWELEDAVIDAGRCIQCGACVAACPSDSIAIGDDDLPLLAKMCTGCSLCWDFCPRGGLRHEATWKITGSSAPGEPVRERYSARARQRIPGAQDGGVVSALLIALLEAGEIDGALLARESATERWKGEPFLARTPEEIAECAGSFYNQTLALGQLDAKAFRKRGLPPAPRLALVGTPCETEAIRAMQARPWFWGSSRPDAVVLTIALLCTKSFNYEQLMVREIADERGIPLDSIGRVDVIRGKLILDDHEGETILEEPIKDFHGAALKGCDECADFLGNAADLSVGSVGAADGRSSLLVRTEVGRRALGYARDRLDLRDLDRPEALDKLDALDKRIAFATMKRPFDPDAPLFIDYREHLAAYEGTDRAPAIRDY